MNGDKRVTWGSNVVVKQIAEKENGKQIAWPKNTREKLYQSRAQAQPKFAGHSLPQVRSKTEA